jgi:hypothetical protein
MSSTKTGFSLKSLDARAASEVPFEFEYIQDGVETGVWFSVLGGQSSQVTSEVNSMMNDRRRAQATKELAAKTGGRKPVDFVTVESDLEFGERVAAVRLVGWRTANADISDLTKEQQKRFAGIEEPYTPELALELIRSNQVAEKSSAMGNFMKSSPLT